MYSRFREELRRTTTGNRRLAKKRVQWFIEHSTSYQLLCWVDSLVLRNPLLRQAPKRYVKALENPAKYETNFRN
jgi:hypothetical protein